MKPGQPRTRVVIVGAGFGGLWAAKALASSPAEVVLIDRNNYHTFFPLLYQVAAAELEPEDIAYPVRSVLRKLSNVRFIMGEVKGLDLERRTVECEGRAVPYDYLILATGSVPNYFSIPGADDYAFPLRTLEHGVALRNHILSRFEQAEQEPDEEGRRRILAFTIVGGGPTGVEFAGALAELIYGPLAKDYQTLDINDVSVTVLEAADGLLPGLPPRLRDYALKRLRRMKVDVRLKATVSRISAEAVHLKDDGVIETETVVWTAGVGGSSEARGWRLPVTPAGRVSVQPTLQVPGHPEIYVAGDSAWVESGPPLAMIAPVATQQGQAAALNIRRQMAGREPLPFRYKDLGTMAVVGRNSAVALLGGRTFTGLPAWAIWLTVHLFKLIGFRNRLMVLTSWAWDYLFYERVVRLILPRKREDDAGTDGHASR